MKIDKLDIKNFKFFNEVEALNFESKNVLVYGENGSGKSTIYWALYTLLQSSKKNDDKIKKYFTHSTDTNRNDSSLVNIYADDNNSKIELFVNEDRDKLIISKNEITIKDNTKLIEDTLTTSDFVNYKYLFRFFNFLHKDEIDLFELFEYEILHLVGLNELWKEIVNLEDIKPRKIADKNNYNKLQTKLTIFNTDLKDIILNLNEPTNKYLKKFNYEDIKLILSIEDGHYRKQIFTKPQIKVTLSIIKDGADDIPILRPQSYFNEAKLTAIALSVRLAITEIKLKDSPLKLLVLDDLLVSLDMSNRDKVLDILLNDQVLNEYQKIILTHDKAFFEMAKHKFNYKEEKKWKYFEMYVDASGDFEQPFINKESLNYLEKAKKYFDLNEYEIAGNFLRKEAESFCKDFLPKKLHYGSKCNLRDLNGLIIESIDFATNAGLDDTLFKELDNHRKFVFNPTSHDNHDVPKYKSEIKSALDTLNALREIKNEPFLTRGDIVEFELMTPVDKGGDTYTFEIKLEDDFRLLTIKGQDTVISKGCISYWIMKNSKYMKCDSVVKKDDVLQYGNSTLQSFYDFNYKKSDKVKNSDFWKEIERAGEKIENLKN